MIRASFANFLALIILQSICALSIMTSEKASEKVSLNTLEQIENGRSGKPETKNMDEFKQAQRVKLEEEIDEIGKEMEPDSVSATANHVGLNMYNPLETGSKLKNLTVTRAPPTESSKLVVVDQSMDGVDGLEAAGEQLRHEGENEELAELGEHKGERHEEEVLKHEVKDLNRTGKFSLETKKVMEENATENATEQPTEIVNTTELNESAEERHDEPEETKETVVSSTALPEKESMKQKITVDPEEETKESAKKEGINGGIMLEEPIVKYREEQKENEKQKLEEENDKISWELLQFLFMLFPTDKEEVPWWTVVVEAVKCSLRNCPNSRSYWHHGPIYLPRITRHRRQDDEFDPYAPSNTSATPKPCPCKNLETYFERIYEKSSKSKQVDNEK